MLNSIKLIFLLIIWWMLPACNVVELETPPDDTNVNNNSSISGPTTLPSDEAIFLSFLTGPNGKTWEAGQFTLQGLSGFQDCRLDDKMTLNPNGNYIFDGGTISCGGEDRSAAQDTWQIDFANRRISFALGNQTFQGTITGLSETMLVIQGTYLGLEVKARYDAQ
ncbi:MAG: hypothetical protein HC880_09830 [Bacteroidia bacterium]|nr:hypothetical protein [Bacteroidia bacterium]